MILLLPFLVKILLDWGFIADFFEAMFVWAELGWFGISVLEIENSCFYRGLVNGIPVLFQTNWSSKQSSGWIRNGIPIHISSPNSMKPFWVDELVTINWVILG